jgi:mycothiol system anti-sigma-R factor
MSCEDMDKLLQPFLDRELSENELQQVQAHLDACPPCVRVFHLEVSLRRVVRRACSESAPQSLRARILHHQGLAPL